ncbi:hypothetical protein LBMAG33_1880 [Candidatus Levyibacteriota bacterium]|nr:hypothetical protein [Candidatus Levybacteria bacterium]GDX61878.1 hypothetical protein LBMAG33_1880 [Candidatus Levybacteria bacterium]
MNNKTAVIILAGGRGKRMQSKNINKVALSVGNRPMIVHIVDLFVSIGINIIIVVIGYAKKSVINALIDFPVIFAEQKKRLGTAHAVKCGLRELPENISNVLVLQGDDSAFYSKKLLQSLLEIHLKDNADLTFLTIEVDNPYGLGRIIRDKSNKIIAIVEEKDANDEQKKIKEINPACYVFRVEFLKKYINKIKKSLVTKEYYLTTLIDIAKQKNKIISNVMGGNLMWRGINTKEELAEAERLFLQKKII